MTVDTTIVVTRYGGAQHLAEIDRQYPDGRFLTICRGTSAWTLASWARNPDHPLGITSQQMTTLPFCDECQRRARKQRKAKMAVTTSSQWVAIISRRTVGGVENVVGPFSSEEKAQGWLDSMKKPGYPLKMQVVT